MSPSSKVGAGANRQHPAVPGPRRQARQNVPDEPVLIDVEVQALFSTKLFET
jgi:hypothetical protein